MKRSSPRPGLLCLAAALAFPQAANPQVAPQVPSFASKVELITVDAVVVDDAGRPVAGLTRGDFVIKEDGRSQQVASFEAFTAEAAPATLPSAVVASNEAGAGGGRTFSVVFDDMGITPALAETARGAIASFLERSLRDGDEVTLATSSGDGFWSARLPEGRPDLLAILARTHGRKDDAREAAWMSDYEAFWIATREDSPAFGDRGPKLVQGRPVQPTSTSDAGNPGNLGSIKARVVQRWINLNACVTNTCESQVRARAAEIEARRSARTRLSLQAVRRQLEANAPIRGRKSLLLLSEGFLQDWSSELRDLAALTRESNTAIYFIDVRGLVASPAGDTAASFGTLEDPRDQAKMGFEERNFTDAGSQALADASGGFSVRNTNDLGAGIDRIAEESRVFYLLGFYPPEGKSEREWRKLEVEVTRPGLTVRARRGYTLRLASAAKPDKKKEKGPATDPAMARALDSAHPAAGVPLRAMSYVLEPRPKDLTHVVLAAEVDADRLALASRGDSRVARLDVSVAAVNRDSGRGFRHDDSVEVVVKAGVAPGWRALAREFELPKGVTQVRVVVRDAASGALGSVTQRFEVPAPGTLRLSTPILTDRIEPPKEPGEKPRAALAVHRVFAPAGALYCQFEVFGATLAGPGAARVSAGLDLLAGDGRGVRHADPTPIALDANGRVVRLLGLGLDGLAEGPYELVLQVEDLVSGVRVERHEAFVLASDAARSEGSR
jgi:VWFA-related protein